MLLETLHLIHLICFIIDLVTLNQDLLCFSCSVYFSVDFPRNLFYMDCSSVSMDKLFRKIDEEIDSSFDVNDEKIGS